ncbi:hypothetical protein PR048_020654 [Dryococelus australis]|uniref:Uncharacterized protein n=1 Tax=Dryococelus australis TaxID=614101 RepID=A0ABQ9H6Z7_9NEOP|nr:hypothetical protein PR048_020654 [Dryococelus australis]
MEQRRNKRVGELDIPEKNCRPAASSHMILACGNPGVTWPGKQSNRSATVAAYKMEAQLLPRGTEMRYSESMCNFSETSFPWMTIRMHIEPTWWTNFFKVKISTTWIGQQRSPDINPTEQDCNALVRQLAAHQLYYRQIQSSTQPKEFLNHLAESMWHHYTVCMAVRGELTHGSAASGTLRRLSVGRVATVPRTGVIERLVAYVQALAACRTTAVRLRVMQLIVHAGNDDVVSRYCSPLRYEHMVTGKLNILSSYNRQKDKSKYRNRIWLERAFQKQYSDSHKTPYDLVKRCLERKKNIKASERVNVDVFTQNKRPGGGNGRSPSKHADQRHRSARIPHLKIRSPGRGLNPDRLGGRRAEVKQLPMEHCNRLYYVKNCLWSTAPDCTTHIGVEGTTRASEDTPRLRPYLQWTIMGPLRSDCTVPTTARTLRRNSRMALEKGHGRRRRMMGNDSQLTAPSSILARRKVRMWKLASSSSRAMEMLIPPCVSLSSLEAGHGTGMKGRGGKGEIPEKTRRPTASSGSIPTCENPVTRPRIEPGSPWWEVSVLIAQPPWPPHT